MIEKMLDVPVSEKGKKAVESAMKCEIRGNSSREKLDSVVDAHSFQEYFSGLVAGNCIDFDEYEAKLCCTREKTGEMEAVIVGKALVDGICTIMIIMNHDFIMGSMGLAAGEKIARAFELATESNLPVVAISSSGGARLQEGIFSLVQMIKTVDAVKRHSDKGLLYISVISNITLGGVSASFASMADIILMEEDAIFGFTGKKIVEETYGKQVSKDFQNASFQYENGHVDRIIKKEDLKVEIAKILKIHTNKADL